MATPTTAALLPLPLLLLLLLASRPCSAGKTPAPVLVSVYYESLCPDSQRFITTQLYPVWTDLKDIMVLDVNAYGKAKDTVAGDGYTFECQHGPNECEGNMMLTCAKKYIPNEQQFMAFTNCIMTNFVGVLAGRECAREAGAEEEFTAIENCYNSVEGQQLLHDVGVVEAALDPPISYVPWILINDMFTEEQLNATQEDLRKVVCDAYQGQKPELCNERGPPVVIPSPAEVGKAPGAVKVSLFYASLCPDSQQFITSQLYPVWTDLKDIMVLDIIAYGKSLSTPVGNGFTFECQSGPNECEGNMMQACAKRYIRNEEQFMVFTNCVMTKLIGVVAGKECAREAGVVEEFMYIEKCYTSLEGQQLVHHFGGLVQDALEPPVYFIPWIIINDVFTKEHLEASLKDLRKVVCDAFKGQKPELCNKRTPPVVIPSTARIGKAPDAVRVSLYYASLCPDSQQFINAQLYPVWNDLKDIMVLDINAHGKAKGTPAGRSFTFECQHGPNECEGNMMLTCAKKYIPNEEQFMAFTNCIMTKYVVTLSGKECAKEAGVGFAAIENCYTSVEGQKLLHYVDVMEAALNPPIDYIPWILINDVFTKEQLNATQLDLRKVVCDAYKGQKPELCSKRTPPVVVPSPAEIGKAPDAVKVSLYYESLCPDSQQFIISQLYPVWTDLKDIMVLDIIVFGKAMSTPVGNGFTFGCQHGPNECEGNMMLACAKRYISNEEQFMVFTNCVMTKLIGVLAGRECAREAGVVEEFMYIEKCYTSVEGQQLVHFYGGLVQDALEPPVYFIPWIVINDVFTKEQLEVAQKDLRKVVCDAYQGPKPELCSKRTPPVVVPSPAEMGKAPDAVRVSVYYASLCPDSQRFITSQLYPVWTDLKDIMVLDIIAYGKTSSTPVGDGFTFECQSGPNECEGNMMQACAKRYIPNEEQFMVFTNCVMTKLIGVLAGRECAREAGAEEAFTLIEKCYTSVEGQQLVHYLGGLMQDALEPPVYFIPWVIINDVFTKEQLEVAQTDLRKVVCDAYQGPKPELCSKRTPPVVIPSPAEIGKAPDAVRVSLYYDSLSPDSQRFVITQLYPVWTDLKDIMVLDVNAYGKTSETVTGVGYAFECQRGPEECEGNMMLTCAKKYLTNEEQFMAFTNCVMTKFVGIVAGMECAKEAGVGFAAIENCYTSAEGQWLLHYVGVAQEALEPPAYYIPWIFINDVFTKEQLNATQEDLRTVVCDAYQGKKPDLCSKRGPPVIIS